MAKASEVFLDSDRLRIEAHRRNADAEHRMQEFRAEVKRAEDKASAAASASAAGVKRKSSSPVRVNSDSSSPDKKKKKREKDKGKDKDKDKDKASKKDPKDPGPRDDKRQAATWSGRPARSRWSLIGGLTCPCQCQTLPVCSGVDSVGVNNLLQIRLNIFCGLPRIVSSELFCSVKDPCQLRQSVKEMPAAVD